MTSKMRSCTALGYDSYGSASDAQCSVCQLCRHFCYGMFSLPYRRLYASLQSGFGRRPAGRGGNTARRDQTSAVQTIYYVLLVEGSRCCRRLFWACIFVLRLLEWYRRERRVRSTMIRRYSPVSKRLDYFNSMSRPKRVGSRVGVSSSLA